MFTYLFLLVELCASVEQFTGNRTHYPNLLRRNGSADADQEYFRSGKGDVKICFTDSKFSPIPKLLEFQNTTARGLDLKISYSSDLVRDCSFVGDILVMDATQVGAYEDCLLDIYAWDFNFASGIDNRVLQNGISRDKLLALPFEFYKSILVYNKEYLIPHGYDTVPTDLASFTDMVKYIQTNERGAENYNLKGFAAAFSDKQVLVSWISELTAGVSGYVFKDRFNSIATGNFSNSLSHIISWIEDSVFDVEDFSRNWNDILELFIARKSIFIHADPLMLANINIPFDWDTASMPGLSLDYEIEGKPFTRQGMPSGAILGSFIAVNKYAANPSGALKLLQALTSENYQRALIGSPEYLRGFLMPYHPSLLSDSNFCANQGSKCSLVSASALRPSTISGPFYESVTSIIYNEMISVFNGAIDVGTGVESIDDRIRILLNYPARNSTLEDFDDVAPSKASRFKNLMEQVLLLLFFVGVGVTIAVMYKRRNDAEEEREKAGLLPMHDLTTSETAGLVKNIDRD